ncbi:MAG: PAS domain-containing sensor histidine kinase [Promethearchaeota archaeon]|nr:MAG: PAS domain-containing sensor histidine kinase [Candidatus Lokiarchaeota archaeon]
MRSSQKSKNNCQDSNRMTEKLIEIEDKLQNSEKKYRDLLESSQMGFLEIDAQKNKLKYINAKLLAIIGYPIEEIKNADIMSKIIHPEDFDQIFNSLGNIDLEFRIYTKDTQLKWLAGTRIGKYNEKNELVSVRIWLDDITEKKIWEQKLKESEEKYRNLINASPNLIFLFNDDGTIIDCNKSVEIYFEISREQIISNKIFVLLTNLTEDFTLSLFDQIKKNIKNGIIDPIEFSYTTSKGQPMWYQLYYSIVNISEKSYIHVELQDFTKLKKAEEIIREENKKLMELDKIRKKFLDTAAHELKTPLTSVYGAIQLLYELNRNKMSEDSLKFIEIAQNGSKKLRNLILNLLDISKLETHNFKLHKSNYNLVDLIEDCVNEMKYLLDKKEHMITFELPEETYLNIDKDAIERVIINLLSNAVKYTPPKGKITIKLQNNESHIELSIKDTGIGLTEEEIQEIFTKFNKIQRSKEENIDLNKEGTGLGLNISKEIIELHGGQIWVTSEGRNKGSTFIVRLPKEQILPNF